MTEPVAPNPALDEALARIGEYGWLVFTSPTGVRVFLEHLRETRFDLRRLGGVRLAAIGPSTAGALEERGCCPRSCPNAPTPPRSARRWRNAPPGSGCNSPAREAGLAPS